MIKSLNIKNFCVKDDVSIVSAIKKINKKKDNLQFLIIVNSKYELIGTLTDGDIRRSLLKGKNLTGNVKEFMHKNPIFGYENQSKNFINLLLRVSSLNPFLPVIDKNGMVCKIVINSGNKSIPLYAMIMAGGFGKRLGNKTKNLPKPLVLLNGKPLILHVIERLENLGVKKIYISVYYLSEKVSEFIKNECTSKKIQVIVEEEPLGTAGSLGLLPSLGDCNLIVTNCDIVTNLDFNTLVNFHLNNSADCTLSVANYRHEIPFGVVKYDRNGNYLRIEEKPDINEYVYAGICCLSSSFLNLSLPRKKIDMPDFLQKGHENGLNISIFPIHEKWNDVGSPEDFKILEKFKL